MNNKGRRMDLRGNPCFIVPQSEKKLSVELGDTPFKVGHTIHTFRHYNTLIRSKFQHSASATRLLVLYYHCGYVDEYSFCWKLKRASLSKMLQYVTTACPVGARGDGVRKFA
jgi:hypothetical protein